jgi:5-methylcytosine-specific restriction endonuclease McrA
MERECKRHGTTKHRLRKDTGTWRCCKCQSADVSRRRRKVKAILVQEAGGFCVVCGYDKYVGAMDFHHIDPLDKSFTIGNKGMTYSLSRMRAEAKKCVLLCKNCHAEVEGGITFLGGEMAAAPDC